MQLLDSSALIEVINRDRNASKILEIGGEEPAAATVFSIYELLNSPNQNENEMLIKLFEGIEIINFDKSSAIISAQIEQQLRKKRKMINFVDILISSICVAKQATLITLDKDFLKVPGLNVKLVQ